MTIIQAIILGIVQGATEFLPISSSGHLLILPHFFQWPEQSLAFDVMLHLGSLLAVMFFFRREIFTLILSIIFFRKPEYAGHRKLFLLLCVGILPAGIMGYLYGGVIEEQLRTVPIVLFNLIFWGVLLIAADWYADRKPKGQLHGPLFYATEPITLGRAFIIGVLQTFSLIPGTSRSGITITTGIFTRMSRTEAAQFSFLMSIPLILGAALFKMDDFTTFLSASSSGVDTTVLAAGFISSAVVGFLSIKILMSLLQKAFGLTFFGVYRILIALFFLFLSSGA